MVLVYFIQVNLDRSNKGQAMVDCFKKYPDVFVWVDCNAEVNNDQAVGGLFLSQVTSICTLR